MGTMKLMSARGVLVGTIASEVSYLTIDKCWVTEASVEDMKLLPGVRRTIFRLLGSDWVAREMVKDVQSEVGTFTDALMGPGSGERSLISDFEIWISDCDYRGYEISHLGSSGTASGFIGPKANRQPCGFSLENLSPDT